MGNQTTLQASKSHIVTAPFFFFNIWRQNLDLRCVLLPAPHPAPKVLGVPTTTRLESSIQKFKPNLMCRPHLCVMGK